MAKNRSKRSENGITALYERLSKDDELQGESNSIIHQKEMLENYANSKGYSNLKHYSDDGWSGASFDRPAWNKLIEDVKADKVAIVIVKDLSRVGRDHLQVGFFTDVLFRDREIHFIAIENGVDSDHEETSDFAPFLNIMNEWYVKDTSKKIKSVLRMRGMSGKAHTSNVPCYGYLKDPDNHDHWIIDNEAAEVVRHIYKLCIDGKGPKQIAEILREEKVERPSYHWAKMGVGNNLISYDSERPYEWTNSTVAGILSKSEYLGNTVNFKTYKKSYKDKKRKKSDEKDLVTFEGSQEPIIDQETWDIVQRIRQNRRRRNDMGEANPLTGLVYCADCGAIMYNHRERAPREKKYYTSKGEERVYIQKEADSYDCSTHTCALQRHEDACSSHSIPTETLRKLVLESIKEVCSYAVENEDQFIALVEDASNDENRQYMKTLQTRIDKNDKKMKETDKLIRRIYEDNVSGKLSDKMFDSMLRDYEADQAKLEDAIDRDTKELNKIQSENRNVEKFLELAKKYTSFDELTPTMINEFVEKILVHKAVGTGANRVMEVEIYFNFVGKFTVPHEQEVLTEEDAEAKRIAEDKLERKRASGRKYMAKMREKNKALRDQEKERREAQKAEELKRLINLEMPVKEGAQTNTETSGPSLTEQTEYREGPHEVAV